MVLSHAKEVEDIGLKTNLVKEAKSSQVIHLVLSASFAFALLTPDVTINC
jgi:hypothetical protein